MNTAPIPLGRQSKTFGDNDLVFDESSLMSHQANTQNRGPRALTDDLIRQRIQTRLDREYGITIRNGDANHLIKTLLDNDVPREDLIEAGTVEVVEGQVKAFFLNMGLVLIPLDQALETTRALISKIAQHAPAITTFYRERQTEGVLTALWNAHNGSLDGMLDETSKEQLAKIGYPDEAEFDAMIEAAKRKKRGTKGYIAGGEALGWFLVGEDPKVRESWSVA